MLIAKANKLTSATRSAQSIALKGLSEKAIYGLCFGSEVYAELAAQVRLHIAVCDPRSYHDHGW